MSGDAPVAPARDDCWNTIGVWGSVQPRCPLLTEVVHCHNCEVYVAAGQVLFERPASEGYLAEWAERLERDKEQGERPDLSLLVFRLGTEHFALPTALLEEVADALPVRSIPHRRDPVLMGLVNVRGRFQLCGSLTDLLGLERPSPAPDAVDLRRARPRTLVVFHEAERWAFPVDEVLGIHSFHSRQLRDVPATVARSVTACTRGLLTWRGVEVGCLDCGALFSRLKERLV